MIAEEFQPIRRTRNAQTFAPKFLLILVFDLLAWKNGCVLSLKSVESESAVKFS